MQTRERNLYVRKIFLLVSAVVFASLMTGFFHGVLPEAKIKNLKQVAGDWEGTLTRAKDDREIPISLSIMEDGNLTLKTPKSVRNRKAKIEDGKLIQLTKEGKRLPWTFYAGKGKQQLKAENRFGAFFLEREK